MVTMAVISDGAANSTITFDWTIRRSRPRSALKSPRADDQVPFTVSRSSSPRPQLAVGGRRGHEQAPEPFGPRDELYRLCNALSGPSLCSAAYGREEG